MTINITEEQIREACRWANAEVGRAIDHFQARNAADAIISEAFRKLLPPEPVFPTLAAGVKHWIEGWVAGIAHTQLPDAAAVCSIELLDTIEPHVDCDCSKGESEKARLMEEIRQMIRKEREIPQDVEPTPPYCDPQVVKLSEMDTLWVDQLPKLKARRDEQARMIEREKLEAAWLNATELTPEKAGVALHDFTSGSEGLVGEAAIQAWQRVKGRARRELQKTLEGRQLIAHIENHPIR